ncbi:Hypothetical protein I595_2846 [Croceitalea dokdonensis DOKDO 023]|uniref:Uncharacterized protein n=1 Tax=Croceitalea dokdonensis DOKDO 023 TaxID=1300341 RepID=A0A0P7AX06_9FLAO|nr:Hypothetical protein I595_2846 [Croceitalea dokdonensis DOKDO 023]
MGPSLYGIIKEPLAGLHVVPRRTPESVGLAKRNLNQN